VKRPHACANRTHAAAAGAGSFSPTNCLSWPAFPFHPRRYYEDYPQIENGIGLVRMLLEEWAALKRGMTRKRPRGGKRQVLIVTSESAHPYLCTRCTGATGLFPRP